MGHQTCVALVWCPMFIEESEVERPKSRRKGAKRGQKVRRRGAKRGQIDCRAAKAVTAIRT